MLTRGTVSCDYAVPATSSRATGAISPPPAVAEMSNQERTYCREEDMWGHVITLILPALATANEEKK
ncbi:hypothetical protein GCM10023162_07780 [Klenkia terrae]